MDTHTLTGGEALTGGPKTDGRVSERIRPPIRLWMSSDDSTQLDARERAHRVSERKTAPPFLLNLLMNIQFSGRLESN